LLGKRREKQEVVQLLLFKEVFLIHDHKRWNLNQYRPKLKENAHYYPENRGND
jgi:hypothetical protein